MGSPTACCVYFGILTDFCHLKVGFEWVDHSTKPLWAPLFRCGSVSCPRLRVLLSHFLILDLPKIALTGDINGLLLVSP